MAKTDRQTDKGTWWSVTAFGDEITVLENKETYPTFVKQVLGGREMCPTSKREHFQGAIQCVSQQRLSAFKTWLPKAHLEVAIAKDALMKYAMKADTAIGDKVVRTNDHALPYMTTDRILLEITKYAMSQIVVEHTTDSSYYNDKFPVTEDTWWECVNILLSVYPTLAGNFLNKQLMNLWLKTSKTWVRHVLSSLPV